MLSIPSHSGRSISAPLRTVAPRSFLVVLLLLSFLQVVVSQQTRNVTIPVSSKSIVYTPFVCNSTTLAQTPNACVGAWQLSGDPGAESISTTGPSSATRNIIPQMFFQFQASKLTLTSLPTSNAIVNITLSAGGVIFPSTFDSSTGTTSVVDIPNTRTTLLTLTVLPSTSTTAARFDLRSIVITVAADATETSFLPAPTLPPFASLPTVSSTSPTSTPTILNPPTNALQSNASKTMIAQAVGLTVGLGVGLTLVAVLFYLWWRRRRRQLKKSLDSLTMEEVRSEWRGELRPGFRYPAPVAA